LAVAVGWRRQKCSGGRQRGGMAAAVRVAAWQALWRWQCGGSGGGRGSVVVAASLAVEAAAWWKRNFGVGGSVSGSSAAAQRQQWQCSGGSGSSVVAGSLATAVAAWRQQLGNSTTRKKPYHALGSTYWIGNGSEISLIPIRMI
jgi:hypothetical protein